MIDKNYFYSQLLLTSLVIAKRLATAGASFFVELVGHLAIPRWQIQPGRVIAAKGYRSTDIWSIYTVSLIRRAYLSLLFSLALILSQQGALLHALRHAAEPASIGIVSSTLHSEAKHSVCDQCAAYAQLAGTAPMPLPLTLAVDAQPRFSLVGEVSRPFRCPPVACSRDPPSFL